MFRMSLAGISKNDYWSKIVMFSMVIFFVYLSDAILSDWLPGVIEMKLGGAMVMGVVMSFSSIVGFGADLIFPQMLKKLRSSSLIILAILAAFIFVISLLLSNVFPYVGVFLFAVGIWGIYYEFLSFGNQQFVAENVPREGRSGAWGLVMGIKSIAYFLGPILGGYFALRLGVSGVPMVSVGLITIGFFAFLIWNQKVKRIEKIDIEEHVPFDLISEIEHWVVLGRSVWPILAMSFIMILIDSFYWTVGTILSDKLAEGNFWGSFFLPFYNLPSLFVGLIVIKMGIVNGKKRIALFFLLLSGLLLTCIGYLNSVWLLLGASLLAGTTLAISWPYLDAVYTDLLARMGREKKHFIGLGNSVGSFAYIVGPITAGAISSVFGDKMTFSLLGLLTIVATVVIFLFTPKKIKIPQSKLVEWDKK